MSRCGGCGGAIRNAPRGRLRAWCDDCQAIANRIIRYNANVTVAEVRWARCAICGGGPIVFDHNHATGKFRGFLCHRHNLALGYFRGDELARALEYVRGD